MYVLEILYEVLTLNPNKEFLINGFQFTFLFLFLTNPSIHVTFLTPSLNHIKTRGIKVVDIYNQKIYPNLSLLKYELIQINQRLKSLTF